MTAINYAALPPPSAAEVVAGYRTQAELAQDYLTLADEDFGHCPELNQAIVKRWSESGLRWIKREAWRRLNAEALAGRACP